MEDLPESSDIKTFADIIYQSNKGNDSQLVYGSFPPFTAISRINLPLWGKVLNKVFTDDTDANDENKYEIVFHYEPLNPTFSEILDSKDEKE